MRDEDIAKVFVEQQELMEELVAAVNEDHEIVTETSRIMYNFIKHSTPILMMMIDDKRLEPQIKMELEKLREQFEAMQDMFGAKLARAQLKSPPELRMIKGGKDDGQDEDEQG